MAKQNGTDLGKAYVQIVPSAQGIKASIQEVMGKPLEEQADESGATFGSMLISKIKGAITIAGIGKFLSASLTEGGALQQSIGGVETLFGNSANVIKKAAQTAFKDAGVSANTYMEQTTSFAASLVSSCGGNTAKAAEIAKRAMVDMSDNANKMGTDLQDIQNAYQGFAKQNYTMLDNLKLGYGGTKTEMARLIKDASTYKDSQEKLNVSVKDGDMSFSNIANAISVVQDHMKISGTTAEEASTTLTGSFGMVKASVQDFLGAISTGDGVWRTFKNTISSLGTFIFGNLLPMIGNIGSSIVSILTNSFNNMPGILDAVQKFATQIASQAPQFIKSGFEMLNKLADGIVSALPVMIAKIPTIISTFANIINDNGPTILMCGLKLIAKLALGIIQAIPTLIVNIPKIITAIVDVWSAFNWINLGKMAITGLGNGIKALFGFLKGTGKEALDTVLINIMLLPEKLGSLGGKGIHGLINGIKSLFGALGSAAGKIFEIIVKALASLPSKMLSIGKNIVEGIWKGIWNMGGWITKKIGDFAGGIVKSFKGFLGIHSPSRIMRDMVGRFIGEGIGVGILGSFDTVRKDIAAFNDSLIDEFNKSDSFGASMTFSAVREVKMQLINEGLEKPHSEDRKGDIYQTINITSPDAVDPSEVSRQTRNANRELIQILKGA
ncbi:phage tail protein [Catenibacterium mitsuokai]|uniref:phage tail protein n=1 Tax=Catenibacterium mitsuokai TaxID=100886 RepID=UPI003F8A7DAB